MGSAAQHRLQSGQRAPAPCPNRAAAHRLNRRSHLRKKGPFLPPCHLWGTGWLEGGEWTVPSWQKKK